MTREVWSTPITFGGIHLFVERGLNVNTKQLFVRTKLIPTAIRGTQIESYIIAVRAKGDGRCGIGRDGGGFIERGGSGGGFDDGGRGSSLSTCPIRQVFLKKLQWKDVRTAVRLDRSALGYNVVVVYFFAFERRSGCREPIWKLLCRD